LNLERARAVVEDGLAAKTFTACVVLVEERGAREVVAAGSLCPDPSAGSDGECVPSSLFDLASLTKLATTALLLSYVRERTIGLETPLRELVPDFRGGAKDRVTLKEVLTHTAGLVWWLPLYKEARSADEVVWRAAQEPLAHDAGTHVYSDLGFIMLTRGLEAVGGAPLRDLIQRRVLDAVGAETCGFTPAERERCAATERDEEWRKRRLRGEVHDENAFAMGGISGHAGLFGTAADVAALARIYRDGAAIGQDLASLARTEQVRGENTRRGLELLLRAPDGPMTGRYLSERTYGHTGFTGTSLWIDPDRDLTVVLLENRVYFGRATSDYAFRIAVHEAVSAP
jgi:CubicO group peptidase (beta-lactamase class C family)